MEVRENPARDRVHGPEPAGSTWEFWSLRACGCSQNGGRPEGQGPADRRRASGPMVLRRTGVPAPERDSSQDAARDCLMGRGGQDRPGNPGSLRATVRRQCTPGRHSSSESGSTATSGQATAPRPEADWRANLIHRFWASRAARQMLVAWPAPISPSGCSMNSQPQQLPSGHQADNADR